MARILLSLAEESRAKCVAGALEGGKHELITLGELTLNDIPAAAKIIMEARGDVAIMDYRSEDAASVKLVQTISDIAELNHPAFILIENAGPETTREEILMALNEGVHAFLPADFQPAALYNYVERAILGPGRLHPRAMDPLHTEDSIKLLEEALGHTRAQSLGFQKVIGFLLSTSLNAQNRKVMVVSDSSYQLEMLRKILEDYNFQVLSAKTIDDALTTAMSENPRIIVSDLELEGQTGLELCQAVKFTHKLVPCYFIICTASQAKLAKTMTPGNGVDDCLLKPSGEHDNLELISRVAMGLLL